MADQFSEVTTKGFGGRIMDSIKGVLFGIILFVASFGVLYWNEGRTDLSLIAKTATEIPSAMPNANPALNGKLVSTTGPVTTADMVGDGLFLKPGSHLSVDRNVEMYAWVEDKKSESKKETGGSETTTTTYTYKKDWVGHPEKSENFKHPEDHINPTKKIDDGSTKASTAKIGVFDLDMSSVGLPGGKKLTLNQENITLSQGATLVGGGQYLYMGTGISGTPQVGDLRISYVVLDPGFKGTAFGQLDGGAIASYVDEHDNHLYRVLNGTRGDAISALHAEHTMTTWILRGVGFFMMWIGLSMLFGPISTFLDILPILGSLSRGMIGFVALIVAFVLSLVTILISMIVHSLIAVVVAVVIVLALGIFFVKRKKAGIPITGSSVP